MLAILVSDDIGLGRPMISPGDPVASDECADLHYREASCVVVEGEKLLLTTLSAPDFRERSVELDDSGQLNVLQKFRLGYSNTLTGWEVQERDGITASFLTAAILTDRQRDACFSYFYRLVDAEVKELWETEYKPWIDSFVESLDVIFCNRARWKAGCVVQNVHNCTNYGLVRKQYCWLPPMAVARWKDRCMQAVIDMEGT